MNRRLGSEIERVRRLAKGFALSEGIFVALYQNEDGTYGFTDADNSTDKKIIEYLTPY